MLIGIGHLGKHAIERLGSIRSRLRKSLRLGYERLNIGLRRSPALQLFNEAGNEIDRFLQEQYDRFDALNGACHKSVQEVFDCPAKLAD